MPGTMFQHVQSELGHDSDVVVLWLKMSSNVQDPSVETLFNPTSSLLVPPITPSVSNALLQQSIAHRLPALDPSLSAHPQSTLKIAADQSARFSHAPAVWDAAEEYVRSHMARNTNNTTPATVPKARAKTGGRRGRGGRRSTNKVEVQSTNTELNGGKSTHVTPDTSGRGKGKPRGRAGGRPRVRPIGGSGSGAKRKRDRSEEDVLVKDDTDASETFTPLPTQSRSGRRIFKAATFTPVTIDLESPTPMKSPLRTGKVRIADAGKRVKTQYRKVGDASVCKNCGRGHSPIGNVIVFCDGCNTPWHQYCHDKPISVEVVQIEEKEWFCTDCTILKQEKSHLEGNVGAEGMSISDVCYDPRYVHIIPRLVFGCVISNSSTIETCLFAVSFPLASYLSSPPRHHSPPESSNILSNSNQFSATCKPICPCSRLYHQYHRRRP